MNILLIDGLPEEYEGISLSADFRNMIQADLILHDEKLSDTERIIASLYQIYPEIPSDIQKAIEGFLWFYTRGKMDGRENNNSKQKNAKKAFDFEQDANLIYSAFYSTYNISLTTINFLHWWEFMALFEGLPETTLIQKVMYWRTADISKVSKEERKHILKMREIYSLKRAEKENLSVEEIEQENKDRVARRFAEAKKFVNSQK